MKIRKGGKYAVISAVLLISALLIMNCIEPLNTSGQLDGQNTVQTQTAKGTGSLTVAIEDSQARTVIPTLVITSYGIALTDRGGDTSKDIPEEQINLSSGSATRNSIRTGNYDVTITAYADAFNVKALPIAAVTASNITIEDDDTTATGTLTLTALTTGTGTFTWDLSDALSGLDLSSGSDDTAQLAFAAITGGISPPQATLAITDLNIIGSLSGFPVGVYTVTLTASKDGNYYSFSMARALHIMQNLTSNWDDLYLEEIVFASNEAYQVTYNPSGATWVSNPGPATVSHGGFISSLPAASTMNNSNGDDFLGWYSQATAGFQWLTTTPVLRSRTLFARWQAPGSGHLSITLAQFTIPNEPITAASWVINVDQDDIAQAVGEYFQTITVTNYSGFTNWKWSYEGEDITSMFNAGTGEFKIDLADSTIVSGDDKPINALGPKVISVTAEKGGKTWSAVLIIKINEPA